MCGIGIIICGGIRLDLSSLFPHYKSPQQHQHQQNLIHNPKISLQHLIQALKRRGPDHLGTCKLRIQTLDSISSAIQTPHIDDDVTGTNSVTEFHFIGATLQLRGTVPVFQPLMDDVTKNILVYNGEIFGGVHIDSSSNDTKTLMDELGTCCSCNYEEHKPECQGQFSVLELLSTLQGPWALIYWQDISKTLWFGRDAFGRRSLLVHWPTVDDPRFLLSSVSPASQINMTADSEVEDQIKDLEFWEELSCGIYSLKLDKSVLNKSLVGEVKKHAWTDPVLNELITWERTCVDYSSRELYPVGLSVEKGSTIANPNSANGLAYPSEVHCEHGKLHVEPPASLIKGVATHLDVLHPAKKVLIALRGSVMRRTILSPIQEKPVPIAVLFSGGLDSMILAALLDEFLDPCYGVDLLNVSFDKQFAPDRISARAGARELQRISPSRRWNLVEIDADLSNLTSETEHVMSLINPSKTYMDLNIGIALWLAAGGDGWISNHIEPECQRVKYKSDARILLVGSGADEQCAGYSRHRTKYRVGGWLGLHEEMKLDMQRIWKRNLGRDDRCISDTGKEARFPFLDEDVIKTLLEIPLWEVADLNLPVGKGDKKILREVAQLLGLKEAAFLPKRAIQFGSRIARESNRKNFGSNRAANQASAGSVEIHKP